MFAEARHVLIGFILYISVPAVQFLPFNLVNGPRKSICALKGSSVELSSEEHHNSSMKWYTVYRNNTMYVLNELSADEYNAVDRIFEKSNFTLTINNLKESDAKSYCYIDKTGNSKDCWLTRTELHVADLQVKVIPDTKGQSVTLMCSTSCPLTETPAAYIWYKNREFLYEDWSTWYQELVRSDKAVTYSCAVKGYEDLRAPEVSVDSVTSTCFKVTYANGRMCSYHQKSMDKSCSITYPREVYLDVTREKNYTSLTCNSSCLTSDSQTDYRWYWNKELNTHCESQNMIIFSSFYDVVSCAVKGHKDLLSDEVCTDLTICWSVFYSTRRICALEGSTVKVFSKSSDYNSPSWYKIKRGGKIDTEKIKSEFSRVELSNKEDEHWLTINDVKENDSAEYSYMHISWGRFDLPGVILVVTGLKVTMTPSAVVTEGQRVTLTCTTSCPLTISTAYIWYMNGRPLTLPENQNKHLILEPVSIEHAGNYSCVVMSSQNIYSAEENLTVKAREKSVLIINAVRLTVLLLMFTSVFVLCLWMRKKKNLTSATKLSDKVQTGQMGSMYESIALRPMNPAAKAEQELQEDAMSG